MISPFNTVAATTILNETRMKTYREIFVDHIPANDKLFKDLWAIVAGFEKAEMNLADTPGSDLCQQSVLLYKPLKHFSELSHKELTDAQLDKIDLMEDLPTHTPQERKSRFAMKQKPIPPPAEGEDDEEWIFGPEYDCRACVLGFNGKVFVVGYKDKQGDYHWKPLRKFGAQDILDIAPFIPDFYVAACQRHPVMQGWTRSELWALAKKFTQGFSRVKNRSYTLAKMAEGFRLEVTEDPVILE